jgi:DNA-binding NtrC family response regulator
MKANALLIAKETSDSNAVIAQAASRAGFFLLRANDAKRAFELLRNGLPEIDLVIIDIDPGIHSMAILEAITARDSSPPVIVVTGFEQFEMAPIARRHGAAACIAKPFTATELLARIEDVCPADYASTFWNCDAWGHPYPRRYKNSAQKCSGDCAGCASRESTTFSTAAFAASARR